MVDHSLEGQEMFNIITQKVKGLFVGNKLIKSKLLLYFVLAILTLKIIAVGVNSPLLQNFFFADITKIDLVNLLNDNRQSLGLAPLKESSRLNEVAMAKALDMVKNGYFAHQSPSGLTPWFWFKQAGYVYKYAGENLAVGYADSQTVYSAWFNSPTHKANLLNANYTEVGTAVVSNFEGNSILVVQEFGTPRTVPTPAPVASTPTPKPESKPATVAPTKVPPRTVVIETLPAVQDTKTTPIQEEPEVQLPAQVLGSKDIYVSPNDIARKEGPYYQFLNFIIYQYNAILNGLAWALLLLVMGCIMLNIFLRVEFFNKILMLRSLVLILLLVSSLVLDRNIIGLILPHQITI